MCHWRQMVRAAAGLCIAALLLIGCTERPDRVPAPSGTTLTCEDADGDGFGTNCSRGRDCDDSDPGVSNDCYVCVRPELGCPCDPGTQPQGCFLPNQPVEGKEATMCREGTRYCREGTWSGCEDVHSYVIEHDDPALNQIINPDARSPACDICRPTASRSRTR